MRPLTATLAFFVLWLGNVQFVQADRTQDSTNLVNLYNAADGDNWATSWDLSQSISTWHGVILGDSGNVIALNLNNNNLRGELVDLVLPELLELVLSNNNLLGELPALGGCKKLRFLDLSNNQLDGNLHDFDFPDLETLRLADNKIEGTIPNFTKMPKLRTLILDDNRLDGGLPDFNGFNELYNLWVANNFLDGPIPEFNFLKDLLVLNLSGNRFIGSPPAFRGSSSLFHVDLSHNQLTGFIPSFSRLLFLETLRLNDNRISGTINDFGALKKLTELDISNNLLEGNLPDLRVNVLLEDFNARGNNFTGSIPAYPGLDDLQRLDVGDNQLGDTLPNFSYLPSLRELRVDSNQFKHAILEASTIPALRVLELFHNNFTFEDIFAINGLGLTRFTYGPQKPVELPDTIFTTLGDDVLIDLVSDFSVDNNTYSWYRDEEFLVATAINELLITNVNALDQGVYYCLVRNNSLPALNLFSEEVVIVMDCPFTEITISDSICIGDTLFVNNKPYFETGEYSDTIVVPDPAICDTVFNISLLVNPVFDTTLTDTICESDEVMFAGQIIKETGFYTDTLMSVFGCDSVVHLDLLVRPADEYIQIVQICEGDTLFVGEFRHVSSGIYYDTLQTMYGCDSVIITDLTVIDTFLVVVDTSICYGESVEFRGSTYSETGTYIEGYTNAAGCDSSYVLNLTVQDTNVYPLLATVCLEDSVMVGDRVYFEPGFYVDTLVSQLGCDSIVHLTLNKVEQFNLEYNVEICDGETLFFGGDTLFSTGIYIDSLVARGGCDSIVKLRLSVVDFIPLSIDTLLCAGESIMIGESTYDESGIYRDTLPGILGCDSVVVTRLNYREEVTLRDVGLFLDRNNVGRIIPSLDGGTGHLTYLWNTGDTTLMLDSVPAGMYNLQVFDDGQCGQTFQFLLDPTTNVVDNALVTFDIYPNPAISGRKIEVNISDDKSVFRVELFDLTGRMIFQQEEMPGTFVLDLPNLSGSFLIRVVDPRGDYGIRIVSIQ